MKRNEDKITEKIVVKKFGKPMMSFTERVLGIIKKIPCGEVMTYREIATLAGSPNAVRAVGNITRKNSDLSIPCHRIIKSDGSVGKYNGLRNKQFGRAGKISLLKQEGIEFDKNEKVIFEN